MEQKYSELSTGRGVLTIYGRLNDITARFIGVVHNCVLLLQCKSVFTNKIKKFRSLYNTNAATCSNRKRGKTVTQEDNFYLLISKMKELFADIQIRSY